MSGEGLNLFTRTVLGWAHLTAEALYIHHAKYMQLLDAV